MNISQKIKQASQELTAALDDCTRKPKKKRVHDVRTRCRRLEAAVSAVLSTHGGVKELEEAGDALVRRLKKIRRGAGAVRDLDIHMSLVDDISGNPPQDLDAAKKLKKQLKRERKRAAVEMLDVTSKQQKRFEKQAADFLQLVVKMPPRELDLDTAALASARFLEASAAMPVLKETNLHDFRKRSKSARYVAEIDPRNAASAKLAKKLNEIQDSIGEWHDWVVLEMEAGDILNGTGKRLLGTLHHERTRSYQRALQNARRIQKQLLHKAPAA